MQPPSFDPGLTERYGARLRRVINKDGTFNVRRTGATRRDFHPYLHLIAMPWQRFLAVVVLAYVAVNTLFAAAYYALGPAQLAGAEAPTEFGRFLNAFFFSAHTLTTVGYGNISPHGAAANFLTVFEAMLGAMGFAVGAALVYGRVSRPSARVEFSDRVLIAPYQGGDALEFRLVNRRSNVLMELEARVLLMTVESVDGEHRRNYQVLRLERSFIHFLPLTWTVVHPIDRESPLFGMTRADLERLQAELLILIKGFDETFSQVVHARNSYRYDEIVWGARFTPAFSVDDSGHLVLEVDKVSAHAASGLEISS